MALAQVKKGGPYPKNEKEQRREEVHRLHFDYGYSARKIAGFLKINRNTINGDISNWQMTIVEKERGFNPIIFVMNQIERFEIQRTRLRKQLDNAESFQEKMTIERFIFNIDIKIANFQIRFVEAKRNIHFQTIKAMNKQYEKEKSEKRFITSDMTFEVSKKAQEKIYEIYYDDKGF